MTIYSNIISKDLYISFSCKVYHIKKTIQLHKIEEN